MTKTISKLEANRQEGKNQVDELRVNILDAAEELFLEKGLENTNMSDIAAAAGINRVSLYRYFPDRDPIAFEIAVRMLKDIARAVGAVDPSDQPGNPHEFLLAMIDDFYELRNAYRYLGMFNHLYGDHYPNETLAAWYKQQIFSVIPPRNDLQGQNAREKRGQIFMLLNTIMSFLEKMAGRGDLMADEQGVPVDEQLRIFKGMIQVYLERVSRHV